VRLYDTKARSVVTVVPQRPGQLSIYACGPTVYRDAHVGNMRSFLLPDLICRVAEGEGLHTTLVQNITDVGHMADDTGLGGSGLGAIDEGQGDTEDRILAQAGREGRGALELARAYEEQFHQDLAALNIRPAQAYPRASESIPLMIDLIQVLLENGNAYVGSDGSVFFDARSVPDYGALSGNRLEDLRPGHRFTAEVDSAKRFHADWALWKHSGSSRTQLVWDTPWGRGYPGWHTECSAMSLDQFGSVIDIHTGGIDLRFPHHEDERAQSNAARRSTNGGQEVVQHWVHGEHLLFAGRKMSKSSGNVVLVRDLVERDLDPLCLRLTFLQHRYRQQFNLTWEVLQTADSQLHRWRERVAVWAQAPSAPIPDDRRAAFQEACREDLDTPRALQVLREVERAEEISDGARFETFAWADRILGLDLVRDVGRTPQAVPTEVTELLDQRAQARANREWARSDSLRDELSAMGWQVQDTPDGQQVSPTRP